MNPALISTALNLAPLFIKAAENMFISIPNTICTVSGNKTERTRIVEGTKCTGIQTLGHFGIETGHGLCDIISTYMNNKTAENLKVMDSHESEIRTMCEERIKTAEYHRDLKLKELENENNQNEQQHKERMQKIEVDFRERYLAIQADAEKKLQQLANEDNQNQRYHEERMHKIAAERANALQKLESEKATKLKELENEENQNQRYHEKSMLQETNRHEEVIKLYEYEQERFMTEKKAEILNKWMDISKQIYDSKLETYKQQLAFWQEVCRADLMNCEQRLSQINEDERNIQFFSRDMDVVEKQYYLAYLMTCRDEVKKGKKEILRIQEEVEEKLNKEIKELELKNNIPSFMLPQGDGNCFLN